MVMRSDKYNFETEEEYERHLASLNHLELEEEADRILADHRRETTRNHTEMRDYLSKGQLDRRINREIYNSVGTPDESLFGGITKRAYRPPRDGAPWDLREEEV